MKTTTSLYKRVSILLLAALLAGAAFAQVPAPAAQAAAFSLFAVPTTVYGIVFSGAVSPSTIVPIDIDLDDDLDVAVSGSASDRVYIGVNDGAGNFSGYTPAYYQVGDDPHAMLTGDFNKDGYPDLALVNSGSGTNGNTLAVLLHNGASGGFAAATYVPVGTEPRGLGMGDFDKDGYLDLAVSNYVSATLKIMRNNGSGVFTDSGVDYATTNTGARTIAVADYDNDGWLDIAVTCVDGAPTAPVDIFLNNTTGGFVTPPVIIPAETNPYYLDAGDFDGDGRIDLVTSRYNSNYITVWQNTTAAPGSLSFIDAGDLTVGTAPLSGAVVDINDDGKLDLVIGNELADNVSVLLNSTVGSTISFLPKQDFATSGVNTAVPPAATNAYRPFFVGAADFNGDTLPDVVAVNRTTNNWSLFFNQFPDCSASGIEIHSITNGNWNAASTWQCRIPTAVDNVTVDPTHTVTLNAAGATNDLTIDGTLTVTSSNALQVGGDWLNNGTFTAGTGTVTFNGASAQSLGGSATTTFNDLVVSGPVTLATPVIVGDDLTITSGDSLNTGGQALTINGDFTNSGTFTHASNTTTFGGSGVQNVNGTTANTVFYNVVVGSGSTLTTTAPNYVTLATGGTLTNNGWTDETKTIGGTGMVTYGLGSIAVNVTTRGTLSSLRVERRDDDHPAGSTQAQTGRYWTITPTPTLSGYTVNLTLPTAFVPATGDKVCRYTGSGNVWDCDLTSTTSSSITRNGITELSDWTVLRNAVTTTTIDSDFDTTTYGNSVTFTAQVASDAGTPTGTVTFYEDGNSIGTGALSGGYATLATSTLPAGSHIISASYAGQDGFASSDSLVDITHTVNPRPVTVTAAAKTKVYGDADPGLTYTYTPALIGSDSFSGALDRVDGESVATYAIQQGTLALSTNYTITFVGANLTITRRPITITADAKSKTYGEADPALTYQVTGGSYAPGETSLSGTLGRAAGTAVGTYAINQGTVNNTTNGNYNITFDNDPVVYLTINRRPVTVTPNAQSKVYGDADPTLTYQVTNMVSGETLSGTLSRASGTAVGTYAIQQGGVTNAANGNYNITFDNDPLVYLTITKRPVTVTAEAKTKVYGEADPGLTYLVTNIVSGETLTGALTREAGINVGTYPIQQGTVTNANNTNYTITYVGANLTITKRPITVTADAKSKMYGDADPALSYQTTGSLVAGDSFTGALTRVEGNDAGTYAIQQGNLALSANYNLTYVGANLTITPLPIEVTADAKTKMYGDVDPLLTYTVAPALLSGDTLSGGLARAAGEGVGTRAITQGTLSNANYTITFVGAELTITKRPITITPNALSKTYGSPDPALTYSVTGGSYAPGETNLSGALSRAPGNNVGTYLISQGGVNNAANPNYEVTFEGDPQVFFTINKATLTVTADNKTKKQGEDNPPLTYTITGYQYSDSVAVVTGTPSLSTTATKTSPVGEYDITISGSLTATNYNFVYVKGKLTIESSIMKVFMPMLSK